jgi:nucleoside-diphosphate-sugar epimerase
MILITGGAGYMGCHLARTLLDKGRKVRILDVFHSPHMPGRAQFIEGDIRDAKTVDKAAKGADVILHLAFIQSLSRRPLREKWEINVGGADNVFRAAVQNKVKRLVNASTIELYGACPPTPCTEQAPKDNPVGWYGRHKLDVERLLRKYQAKGLAATNLRMPGICGPGSYNHGPLLDILDRIIAHKPVPLPGDGDIPASLAHYLDVAQAFVLAAESDNAVGESFNIACRAPATHREILQAMKQAVHSRSLLIAVPRALSMLTVSLAVFLSYSDVPDHQVDYAFNPVHISCDKAAHLLGYNPQHSTTDAARDQILGYVEHRAFVRERNSNY